MHFYYVTDKRLSGCYIHPEFNFESPKLAGVKYTPLVRSIHEGCQLIYNRIKDKLHQEGHVRLYAYKLNLNTKMLEQLYTPERIAYEKINNRAFLVNECRITNSTKVFSCGDVIVLKPDSDSLKHMLKYEENGEIKTLAPNFLDHYLIKNTFSNDTSPFSLRKLYPQHTTENRFLSPEYENLCLKYALTTDEIIPLLMQRGMYSGDKVLNPCITFVTTPEGEILKDRIFETLYQLAPKYNLPSVAISTNTALATFFKRDFNHLGDVSRYSSYKNNVSSIYYKDPEIVHCPKFLDKIVDAFTEASLSVLK